MIKTKIVCTLGPASSDEIIIRQMIKSSMDCARINMSHGTNKEREDNINKVKKIRENLGSPVAIMVDTKGPEIRIGEFENGFITLVNGQFFTLSHKNILGNKDRVSCSHKTLSEDINVGNRILLNDGLIVLRVVDIKGGEVKTKVIHGGKLSSKKSMFLPRARLSLPFMSVQDKKDLLFAIKNDADYIAASFVSSKKDVLMMRNFLDTNGGQKIKIISKIESALGVKNIDSIIDASDGIMVARGDLGVELPMERLPELQKQIVRKVNKAGKISIVATEMLESMIEKSRPTRAEVSDVANAVYDRASAVMLSAESAVGKNPVLAVKTMAKIVASAEKSKYQNEYDVELSESTTTESISHSTFQTANEVKAKVIIVFTYSGRTALLVAKFRPRQKIVAITIDKKVYNQLALCWNVIPYVEKKIGQLETMFRIANSVVKELKLAKKNDNILITAGLPLGSLGSTNLIKIERVR